MSNELTCLYRFFGKRGELLYIGITCSLPRRLVEHEGKPWTGLVERVDVEHFPSRELAMDAEAKAIGLEKPLHNVALRDSFAAERSARLDRASPYLESGDLVSFIAEMTGVDLVSITVGDSSLVLELRDGYRWATTKRKARSESFWHVVALTTGYRDSGNDNEVIEPAGPNWGIVQRVIEQLPKGKSEATPKTEEERSRRRARIRLEFLSAMQELKEERNG